MQPYTVIKRDHHGKQQLEYYGELIELGETHVCIRAPFTFNSRDLGYVFLKRGDIFTEWFFTDRWYNIFQINDVDTGNLKGWYCNLTRPAQISNTSVAADDLALDIFVKPDGNILVLDEDEFDTLPLREKEQQNVQNAVQEIRQKVTGRIAPFDQIID